MKMLTKTAHPWLHISSLQPYYRRAGLTISIIAANLFYASFASAQTTLHHIDAVLFTALQMLFLLPWTLVYFWWCREKVTQRLLRQGALAGLLLGIAFIGVALTLRNIGIVRAAMLTSLDGVIASFIAFYFLHQRQTTLTWLGAICAASGAILLWLISPADWQPDFLALLVGLFFCLYALYIERIGLFAEPQQGHVGVFFCVVFLTMTIVDVSLACCFANWKTLQTFSHTDLTVVIYTSCCTIVTPIVLNSLLQRHISAVRLSFAAIIEPLSSIGFAYVQRSLALTPLGWIGISCITLSLLSITIGSFTTSKQERKEPK